MSKNIKSFEYFVNKHTTYKQYARVNNARFSRIECSTMIIEYMCGSLLIESIGKPTRMRRVFEYNIFVSVSVRVSKIVLRGYTYTCTDRSAWTCC